MQHKTLYKHWKSPLFLGGSVVIHICHYEFGKNANSTGRMYGFPMFVEFCVAAIGVCVFRA